MNKHTPGPWNTISLSGDRIAVAAHDAIDVATLTHATRADARLIAAAPELLAALRNLLDDAIELGIEESYCKGSAIEARAAIAKATA